MVTFSLMDQCSIQLSDNTVRRFKITFNDGGEEVKKKSNLDFLIRRG